jgi:hypothetical protein
VVCAKKLVRHFKTGFYFGSYRDTTIKRRITRRVLLRGGSSDRAELEPLYQDILNQCDEVFPGAGAVRVNCLAVACHRTEDRGPRAAGWHCA